jgi:hypothetical protein
MRTNSGLRLTAKSIATFVAATLLLGLSGCAPTSSYPKTAEFLQSKITAKGVEGFSAGKIDFGFTLEALIQVLASGASPSANVKAAEASIWQQTSITDPSGYLIDSAGAIKPGLAGKALVFGKLYGKQGDATYAAIKAKLKAAIDSSGVLKGSNGNAFDYGWATLGLSAASCVKAPLVATKLASLIRADGGFGSDLSASTTASSADATGIALMAFAATEGKGTTVQKAAQEAARNMALVWLSKNIIKGNHFEAWGDVDVNGTEYAAMGLKSESKDISAIKQWLTSRVAKDGGLVTPWSNKAGDTFATIQGLLVLDGRSYSDLVK